MNHDPFDLARFVTSQAPIYTRALAEVRAGYKRTHWMWFIFPQIEGISSSPTGKFYAIKSHAEAKAYLAHPILGPRLIECVEAVVSVEDRSAFEIFHSPDDMKLMACMTLFETCAERDSVFDCVLNKYFDGQRDMRTLAILCDERTTL